MISKDQAVDVIVSGHLCLDIVPHMENVPLHELTIPGRLFETGPLALSTGGAVSNTGLALHRLGVNVRLMAAVGDDMLGRVTLDFLNARDPALGQMIAVRRGQASSYTIVLSPERVDRIFLHLPGPNADFGIADLDFDVIARARIFHMGYPMLLPRMMLDDSVELEEIYRRTKASGAVTSLDTAMPDPHGLSGRTDWQKVLCRVLPYVDIFVPSIEELIFMLRHADYDAWNGEVLPHLTADYLSALADDLLGMGAGIVGFKLSAMGIYLQTAGADRLRRLDRLPLNVDEWANVRVWSPAFKVNMVGTVGAGDSAYAGLLAAMLKGMCPHQAVRWACAVGACNVEAADATSGIRTWGETQARLDAGWPSLDLRLPGM